MNRDSHPPDDINVIIADHAPKLATQLRQAASTRRLEAELILDADPWFAAFARDAGLRWEPRPERRVVFSAVDEGGKRSARIDRLFNSVVDEFEPPHSPSQLNAATAN